MYIRCTFGNRQHKSQKIFNLLNLAGLFAFFYSFTCCLCIPLKTMYIHALDLLFVVSIHHNFPTMNLLPKFSIILIFSHMYNRENQHNKKKTSYNNVLCGSVCLFPNEEVIFYYNFDEPICFHKTRV